MKYGIELKVNAVTYPVSVEPWETLLTVLRRDLGLLGTKYGCGNGDCGACTVLVEGEAMNACMLLAVRMQGREIMTIEGLARGEELHPLQQAFIDHGALQCGYCTPGMILSARALLDENPDPTDDEIADGLAGNLCRCTGYKKIFEAVHAAAAVMRGEGKGV
jgi:carbon-monoxide dehydrogenase small subunit